MKARWLPVVFVGLFSGLHAGDESTAAVAHDQRAPTFDRAVPSDAVFFLHWRSPAKGGFASTHLKRLRGAVLTSGFIDRYVKEYLSTLDAKDRPGVDDQAERWKKVLGDIAWWRLLSREFSLCSRVTADGRFETAAVFRAGEARREDQIGAFRNVLYAIAGSGDGLELEVSSRDGVSTAVLYSRTDYGEQICVTGWRDVVVVSSSTILARQSLHLLQGRGLDVGLVHGKRFRDSRTKLDAHVRSRGGEEASGGKDITGTLDVWLDPSPIFRGFSLLDVVQSYQFRATTTASEIRTDSIWTLTEREDNPLHRALASQPSARELLKRVPQTARSWTVTAGSKPAALYDFILEFAVTVTGQAELAEQIERSLSAGRLRLRGDLLSNLTGRRLSVAVAQQSEGQSSAGKSSTAAIDHVFAFEVRDAEKARRALDTLANEVAKSLEAWNIRVEKPENGSRYVVGFSLLNEKVYFDVVDSFLAVGTSAHAIDELGRVSAGKVKSLADSPAVDWIPAEGDIDHLSKGSWDGTLEISSSLAQLLGLLGTILPDSGGSGAVKPFCVSAPKLIPAIEALDFLRETRAVTVRKGSSFYSSSTTTLQTIAEF